ncbi:hypothetical protein ABK040_004058 [Willaertia magna]
MTTKECNGCTTLEHHKHDNSHPEGCNCNNHHGHNNNDQRLVIKSEDENHMKKETEEESITSTKIVKDVNKKKRRQCCPMCSMFMNKMPESGDNDEYEPSVYEEVANILTHAIPIFIFTHSAFQMFDSFVHSKIEFIAGLIYCICMVILFSVSTLYHTMSLIYGKFSNFTSYFRLMDYAVIYIFIGASYTPWLTLLEIGTNNIFGKIFIFVVWGIAVIGLIKNFSLDKYFSGISAVLLYNIMGWVCAIILPPLLFVKVPIEAVYLVVAGGVFYSAGCYFLLSDGYIPFSHAIWHMFVNMGVLCHFICVFLYLMCLDDHFSPDKEDSKTLLEQIMGLIF